MVRLATRTWGTGGGSGAGPGRGAADPLAVLVHGVTGSSRTWWRVGPALAERGFQVIAVDLRGHGGSARLEEGLRLADLAADVAETVAATTASGLAGAAGGGGGAGGDPVVDLLVGHSLGALVALELLTQRPGYARRLVLEDPPVPASFDGAELADGIETDAARAHEEPEALRRELLAANPTWPPGEAERRVKDLADCDAAAVAAAMRDGGVTVDLAPLAAAACVPMLLVAGEESRGSLLTGPDRVALTDLLGPGSVRVLPTGHSVHREGFDAFMATLDDWLRPAGA